MIKKHGVTVYSSDETAARYGLTKKQDKYPFYCDGEIREYSSGQPLANDYSGMCVSNGALFETWLECGERAWLCVQHQYHI
ncbi:MAG: hypothetical protein NUV63_12085 [Gallionella sp.]|nr:hypothetical protein [Gallionella sp.]